MYTLHISLKLVAIVKIVAASNPGGMWLPNTGGVMWWRPPLFPSYYGFDSRHLQPPVRTIIYSNEPVYGPFHAIYALVDEKSSECVKHRQRRKRRKRRTVSTKVKLVAIGTKTSELSFIVKSELPNCDWTIWKVFIKSISRVELRWWSCVQHFWPLTGRFRVHCLLLTVLFISKQSIMIQSI